MNPDRRFSLTVTPAPARTPPGLPVIVGCGVMGGVLVAVPWLIAEGSPDYPKRWVVFAVGLMVLAAGFQFARQRFRLRFSPEAAAVLDALAGTVIFSAFAVVALSGAFLFGDEIRGGAAWLSDATNNRLGRVAFGAVGVLIAAFAVAWAVVLVRRVRALVAARRRAP